MKTLKTYIYLLFFIPVFLMSCSDDDQELVPDTPTMGDITVSTEALTFQTGVATQNLEFSAASNWTAKADQSWCSVQPSSGSSGKHVLRVVVEANDTYDERNTNIVFQTQKENKRLTITQKQKDALLLTSSKAEVKAVGGTLTVEVKSNVKCEVKIDEAAATWITQEETRAMSTKAYKFRVAQNKSSEVREGSIVFSGNGLTETYKVYQQAAEKPQLVLTKKEYTLDYSKTDITIELKSNTEYEMIVPKVDWLSENKMRALSDYTHYFTVAENSTTEERKAEIKFVYAGETEIVTVTQKPKEVIVFSTDTCMVAPKGGFLSFDLHTRKEFDVEINASWVQRVELTGEEATKQLKFKVDENFEEKERVAEILLKNSQITQKIIVLQKGQIISADVDFLTNLKVFTSDATTQELKIKASKAWRATSEQPWCKIMPMEGNPGEQVVKVQVDANTTYDERNSAITFKVGEQEKKITVTQKQLDALILSNAKAEVLAQGGEVEVKVTSNVNVSYNIDTETATWVSAVATRGLKASTYRFRLSPNTSVEKREGFIVFEGAGKREILTIYQSAGVDSQLVLTKNEYHVGADGETIQIELQSNTHYTMELPIGANWIHEEQTRALSSYTHFIKVDANTSNEERSAVISFNYAGKTERVIIKQAQNNAVLVQKDKIEVESAGGPISLDVQTNVDLTVDISERWVKQIVETRTMVTKTLNFEVEPNESEEVRTATIKVSGGGMSATITIVQKPREIETTEFLMVHSIKNCIVPIFTGSKTVEGTIDWGDSYTEAYRKNLSHTYRSAGNHTFKATLQNVEKVEIKEIEGIESIDLSKF